MTQVAHRQLPPSDVDAALARASRQRLSRYAPTGEPLTVEVRDAERHEPIELPAGAVALLLERSTTLPLRTALCGERAWS